MARPSVETAFDVLSEEIQSFISHIEYIAGRIQSQQSYKDIYVARKLAQLKEFQAKIEALRQEWMDRFARGSADELAWLSGQLRSSREKQTPVEAFREPILEALAELGGEATTDAILRLVESKIQLNPYDKHLLPLRPPVVRWRHTVPYPQLSFTIMFPEAPDWLPGSSRKKS